MLSANIKRIAKFRLLRHSLLIPSSLTNSQSPPLSPSRPNPDPFFWLDHGLPNKFYSSRASPDSHHIADEVFGEELVGDGFDHSFVASEVVNGTSGWSYSPVDGLVRVLDAAHDLTGLPWWMVIFVSTLTLRMALFPVTLLQLKKLGKLQSLFHKLPPPFPPPSSGKSFKEQFMLYQNKRREVGAPSPLWVFLSFAVQAPCFVLWMVTIRQMSLNHHPGFESGGVLWFENLAEQPHGPMGPIFPLLIAGVHFFNVQISFQKDRKMPGMLGMLQKYYKLWLDILTVPILFAGFSIPQGSLVYWLTNSSLTIMQILSLRNPYIRHQLGLPELPGPGVGARPGPSFRDIPAEDLEPKDLLAVALEYSAAGNVDKALHLLRIVVKKDPEMARALVALGEILLTKNSHIEAAEYFERAISKIKIEDENLLVAAQFGLGVSLLLQGRKAEGMQSLTQLSLLEEPKDQWAKVCYFKGLITLASALYQDGAKDEALKYLRRAALYDPSVNQYIQEIERDVADDAES